MVNSIVRITSTVGIGFATLVLNGCISMTPMAFDKQTKQLDTSTQSIVLVTLDLSRQDESRFQPSPMRISAKPAAAKASESKHFKLSEKSDTAKEDNRNLYLIRMALQPGQYTLQDIFGMASAFPINCVIDVPLQLDFNLAPGNVAYAGRIKAVWRKRSGDEFRAGPVLPLLDQALCGASNGSFDIEVANEPDKDIALFKENFPVLNSTTVINQPLSPFDRNRAQQWWDGGDKKVDDKK